MDKRMLYGCIAALGVLLGFDLLTQLLHWKPDLPLRIPLGTIFLGDVLMTFAAMTLGGWIARRGFRWPAVALTALVWLAVIAVLQLSAAPLGSPAAMSLSSIVKFNALSVVLALVMSWLGAMLGESLASRNRAPASA